MSNGEVSGPLDSEVIAEEAEFNAEKKIINGNNDTEHEDDDERRKFSESIECQNKSTVSLNKESNNELNYGFQNSKLVINENKFNEEEAYSIQMFNLNKTQSPNIKSLVENEEAYNKMNAEFEKDNEIYLKNINKSLSQVSFGYRRYSEFNLKVIKAFKYFKIEII